MSATGRGLLPPVWRICGAPGAIVGEDGTVVASSVWTARSQRARALGLLGTPALSPDQALWVPDCGWIHTLGMGMTIACVLLDREDRVLRIVDPVPPWRIVGMRGARTVIEAAAGFGARVRLGERLAGPDQSSGVSSR